MRRALTRRPSPATVIALVALFVALGGTGYAAVKVNGKNITNRTINGKKLKKNTLTGTEINESRLGAVPSARSASTARDAARLEGRTAGSFLAAGAAATDAGKLGGLSPSSFVRRECGTSTGQIRGFVTVAASATFSATYVVVPGYNCSGGTVEARRDGPGRYQVRFNGAPMTGAVATAIVTDISGDAISLRALLPGEFAVQVLNPSPSPGAFEDDSFTLIAP